MEKVWKEDRSHDTGRLSRAARVAALFLRLAAAPDNLKEDCFFDRLEEGAIPKG